MFGFAPCVAQAAYGAAIQAYLIIHSLICFLPCVFSNHSLGTQPPVVRNIVALLFFFLLKQRCCLTCGSVSPCMLVKEGRNAAVTARVVRV